MDYKQLKSKFKEKKLYGAQYHLEGWNKYSIKVHILNGQRSILHCSCYNRWIYLSIRLIEEFELDPNFQDHHGNTSLHVACMIPDNYDIVKYLASICDPFQMVNNDGYTALHIAIKSSDRKVVRLFIKKCKCVQLKMDVKIMKLLNEFWDEEIAKCLILDGGCQLTMEDGTTWVHEFASKGFTNRVLFLLAMCSFDPNLQNPYGKTMLHEFCQFIFFTDTNEHLILEQLILQYKCNPNIEDANGETILHTLCYSLLQLGYSVSRLYVLFFLLCECQMSPYIQLINAGDKTPLLQICEVICQNDRDSSPSILYTLLAKCYPFQEKDDIFTALSIAIKYSDSRVVRYIVAEYQLKKMYMKIMKLVYQFWDKEIAKCLICDGGYPLMMENGTTLLHEFAKQNFLPKVLFLITECNCDPFKVYNANGHTVFDFAIIAKNSTLVSNIINKCGCDQLSRRMGEKIMNLLYHHWDNQVAKCLICDGGLKLAMENGTTLLHKFADDNFVTCVSFLLTTCNCDPFQTNCDGRTVLDCAVVAKNVALVNHLVNKCGCDKLCKTMGTKIVMLLYHYWDEEVAKCLICDGGLQLAMENGTTLLHKFAIKKPLGSRVIFLVSVFECDLFETNSAGYTVLDCAIMAKNGELVDYLINKRGCHQLCMTNGRKIMQLLYDYWDSKVAKCLICVGDCQLTMEKGTTLLHQFACKGDVMLANYLLLECYCDPNITNENGNTILHEFCQHMSFDSHIASHLQKLAHFYKINPNIENTNGETVLHTVCYSLIQQGYYEDYCSMLFFLLHELKMSPHIPLKITDNTLLHTVCGVISHDNHDPSILHYLVVESKCDPRIDKDMLLRTLLRSIILWEAHKPTIDVLCYLLAESRIDPHITLENGKSACLMCHPPNELNIILAALYRGSVKVNDCCVCKSPHNYSDLVCAFLGKDSFIMVVCLNVANHIKNVALFLKLLCYFIAFIKCKCDYYQKLTAYNNVVDMMCLYCLSPEAINDPVCFTAIRKLIIDCQAHVSDEFLYLLLNRNSESCSQVLEELQQYLTKMHPFRIAKCIACNLDSYSPHLIHSINKLDLTTTDESGNTILHLACQYFDGDTTLIEAILSTGKADPLCYNTDHQTPMMLLSKRSERVGAKQKVHQMIHRFGEVQVSHPIESYVNLVVLGNPGVGKSSLVKVIIDRPSSLLGSTFGRFRAKYVTKVDLCTAGIVPHILNDRDLGRIILHDLAGQAEYYSSHTAVLENLLQGSSGIFILVISLADEMLQRSFQFWLTAIENVSHNALQQCHLSVVASHADLVTGNSAYKIDILKKILSTCSSSSSLNIIKHNEIIKLDCRKLGGNQLDLLISSLSSTCESVIRNSVRKMTIYCHFLYDFIQSEKQIVYQLKSLLEIFFERNDLFLPTNVDSLVNIVQSLSSTGLIVFLGNKEFPAKSWIVTDKSILLAELNGVLFAPEDFKEYVGIASNTGVIKLSNLSALFPNYDSELLVKFLQYMELCEVITEEFTSLKFFSDNDLVDVEDAKYIFLPALVKETVKPQIEEAFTFGWYLHCTNTHDFFFSRFLHLALLHLACKYSIHKSGACKFERLCQVWTNGIYWKDTKGVQTLVELIDDKKSIVLLTTCQKGAVNEMVKQIKNIIIEILRCKQQVMPKIDTCEFVIDLSHLQYPLKSWEELILYNIMLIAKCYISDDKFIIDSTGIKQTQISNLVPEAATSAEQYFKSIFADREPKVIYHFVFSIVNQ